MACFFFSPPGPGRPARLRLHTSARILPFMASGQEPENLQSAGESPASVSSFQAYLSDIKRGKGLLQLTAVDKGMTSAIRKRWAKGSFTDVRTDAGAFDAIICTVSYHFHKHGQNYGRIDKYTDAAVKFFEKNIDDPKKIKSDKGGMVTFKNGSSFEVKKDGKGKVKEFKILTFTGKT